MNQTSCSQWRWTGVLVGTAASFTIETTRPLFARVAEHNLGSAKVLERAGFVRTGTETAYANAIGRHITEHVYQLVA